MNQQTTALGHKLRKKHKNEHEGRIIISDFNVRIFK